MLFEVVDNSLFVLDDAAEVFPAPFELLQFELHLLVLLQQQFFKFPPLVPQPLNQLLVVRSHGLHVNRVQTGQSLLHIIQFLLILPLALVDLLLQQLNLVIELLPLPGVVLEVDSELLLQVLNLSIFYFNELAQALEFCVEFLVLVAHVLAEVAYFVVEDLLELVPDDVDLLVLLLHHVHEILPVLLDHPLQPAYLVLLLLPHPLVLLINSRIGVGFFLDLFAHPGQLELILLLCLIEGPSHLGQLFLYPLIGPILLLGHHQLHALLGLQGLLLPRLDLLQQAQLLVVGLLALAAPLPEHQQQFLILGPEFEELLLPADALLLAAGLLLEEHIVLDLVVFGPPQPDPGLVELVTDREDVLLQPLGLPSVEILVVAGGGGRAVRAGGGGRVGRGSVDLKFSHCYRTN